MWLFQWPARASSSATAAMNAAVSAAVTNSVTGASGAVPSPSRSVFFDTVANAHPFFPLYNYNYQNNNHFAATLSKRPLSLYLRDRVVHSSAGSCCSREYVLQLLWLLLQSAHWFDVLLLILLGWFTVPVVEVFYDYSYLFLPSVRLTLHRSSNNQDSIHGTVIRSAHATTKPTTVSSSSSTATTETEGEGDTTVSILSSSASTTTVESEVSSSPLLLNEPSPSCSSGLQSLSSSTSTTTTTVLSPTATPVSLSATSFQDTIFFFIADHISQAARLASVVYFFDCCLVVAVHEKFCQPDTSPWCRPPLTSFVLAKILYSIWAAQRFALFKRHVLTRALKNLPKSAGRITVFNRLGNGLVVFATLYVIGHVLQVELGVTAAASLFAFGSAGTVVFGLASKDFASLLVHGISLSVTNRIRVGDEVYFGDGLCGIVQEIGWMHTTLRQFDEIYIIIPNSQLSLQRVKNVSRSPTMCRVKQNLRFHYRDADKLSVVLPDIIEELKVVCHSSIIANGTRPCRAFVVNMEDTYIEAFVDVHFTARPSGHNYWALRHEVIMAIHRVVFQRHGLLFVETPCLHRKLNK